MLIDFILCSLKSSSPSTAIASGVSAATALGDNAAIATGDKTAIKANVLIIFGVFISLSSVYEYTH